MRAGGTAFGAAVVYIVAAHGAFSWLVTRAHQQQHLSIASSAVSVAVAVVAVVLVAVAVVEVVVQSLKTSARVLSYTSWLRSGASLPPYWLHSAPVRSMAPARRAQRCR